jgi:hypothetical protein
LSVARLLPPLLHRLVQVSLPCLLLHRLVQVSLPLLLLLLRLAPLWTATSALIFLEDPASIAALALTPALRTKMLVLIVQLAVTLPS